MHFKVPVAQFILPILGLEKFRNNFTIDAIEKSIFRPGNTATKGIINVSFELLWQIIHINQSKVGISTLKIESISILFYSKI